VEIAIAASTPESAITFVKANLVPLTQGLLGSQSEVPSGVSNSTGTLMVSADERSLTGGLVIDRDVMLSNNNVITQTRNASLAGPNIISGTMAGNLDGVDMMPAGLAHSLNRNSSTDTTGQLNMVNLDVAGLNDSQTLMISGGSFNRVNSRGFVVTRNPVTERFIDISGGQVGDIFLTSRRMTVNNVFENRRGGTMTTLETYAMSVDVQFILHLELVLPTMYEQFALFQHEQVQRNNRLADLKNWMYTRPANAELEAIWDYNIAVTNAIMNTFGIEGTPIRSGYLMPSISILVNWLPGTSVSQEHLQEELRRIQREFLTEIGTHLPLDWFETFLGVTVVGNMAPSDFLYQLESELLIGRIEEAHVRDGRQYLLLNPPERGVMAAYVPIDLPLWAGVYFEHRAASGIWPTRFFHLRSHLPELFISEIKMFDGPNRLFGVEQDFSLPDTDGETTYSFAYDMRYALDEHNALFLNLDASNYQWNDINNSIVRERRSTGVPNLTGRHFYLNGTRWFVVKDDGRELYVVADEFLMGVVTPTDFEHSSGLSLVGAAETWVMQQIVDLLPDGIRMDSVVSFIPFDTTLAPLHQPAGTLVALPIGNELVAHTVTITLGGRSVVNRATTQQGQQVWFRPFARLNRSLFHVMPQTEELVWFRTIPGADYRFYEPANNVLLMQTEMIPFDSENLVAVGDLPTGRITIGDLNAFINNDGTITALVPFRPGLLDDANRFLLDGLRDLLTESSSPVIVGDDVFLSADFFDFHSIAVFDPDFPDYHYSLVSMGNDLFVATGYSLSPYTPFSRVDSVAVATVMDEGVEFLVARDRTGQVVRAVFSGRQETVPRVSIARRSYDGLLSVVSVDSISSFVLSAPPEVAHFHEISRSMLNDFAILSARRNISMVVWFIMIVGMIIGVFIFLARVLWRADVARGRLESLHSASGVDVLACMSLTLVRVTDDEPQSWLKITLWSFTIAVAPSFLVFLIQAWGVPLL
jgi:hypothetical protein